MIPDEMEWLKGRGENRMVVRVPVSNILVLDEVAWVDLGQKDKVVTGILMAASTDRCVGIRKEGE